MPICENADAQSFPQNSSPGVTSHADVFRGARISSPPCGEGRIRTPLKSPAWEATPGGVDPGKKIYSTSLKECFVSKVYGTYKDVNGNPGCSSR